MMDAATKLRQFHSTTPVWAKEDRAVLLASADHFESQSERIRVLREVVESAAAAYAFCADAGCRERLAAMARAALEASNE